MEHGKPFRPQPRRPRPPRGLRLSKAESHLPSTRPSRPRSRGNAPGRVLNRNVAWGRSPKLTLVTQRREVGAKTPPLRRGLLYSARIPANLTTRPHFSISVATSFAKSAGEPGS